MIVIIHGEKLIAIRDPHGLRSLCFGKINEGFVLSSESCAFSVMGAEFIRDVEPGEMIIIENNEIRSTMFDITCKESLYSFEYVYFARSDSVIDGEGVYSSRINAGQILAKEHPVEADLVIAVPDSGTVATTSYARESKIPFGEGLLKNRYIGRTFIEPIQKMREQNIKLKLNVLKQNVKGKRLIVVDDSIVQGITSSKIVEMLRKAELQKYI